MAFALAAATFIGLASETMRPGHHVHLGAEAGHHHHFFLGPHAHEETPPVEPLAAGPCESPAESDPGSPERPDSELVEGFYLPDPGPVFTLEAPSGSTPGTAPRLAAAAPSLDLFLPGGSRAPPLAALS